MVVTWDLGDNDLGLVDIIGAPVIIVGVVVVVVVYVLGDNVDDVY